MPHLSALVRPLRLVIALGAVALAFMLLAVLGSEAQAVEAPTCTAGNYLKDGACVPADPGHFVAEAGAEAQTKCASGEYQDQPGQSSCKVIPLGSGGAGGQADGTGSTSSVLCEPGTFRGDAGTTKCATAAVGTFVSTTGAQVWTICEVGQYQDETGQIACKQVPAGSEGTGGKTDGKRATGVRLCLAGTFQPSAGGGACTPAPAGSHVPVAGATAAALCPAGSYSAATGATTCTPASIGSYVPRPGSTAQMRCPTATTTGQSTCPAPVVAPTAPVTEAPATGSEPLSPQGDECAPGSWSATGTSRAGSSCTPASPGTFVALPGATAAEPCAPGSFSDGFGATECTLAPVGTFVAQAGAMDPTPCPGATRQGLTSCPELLATPAVGEAPEPSSGVSIWIWAVGLLIALGAGGAGFLALQRRPGGMFDAAPDLPDAGPGPAPSASAARDVLEWDEALDGALDDEQGPPPEPRG